MNEREYGKLDPEFKKRWLEALRSGEYKQNGLTLRIRDTFCCIGVACDLLNPNGWGRGFNGEFLRKNPQGTITTYLGYSALPGSSVRERIKLSLKAQSWLVHLNLTKTFPEIADWIEENL